jgi:eukaryotic translation initiation factor 2C
LVERDVTHPFEYDFYLNSHSAIQGTARPVHYHVLLDEANVPANKLHAMIYQHCYQYIRSTTPVSLYPAVYYAHLASNRARAHEDAASDLGPRGGQKFEELLQRRNQLQTAGVLPAGSLNTIRSTEAKPLITLGALGSDNAKATIKTSMWYI